jgi:hypothetical protein
MLAAWNKRSSPLKTAIGIMKDLLGSIDPKAVQTFATKRLAALLAHRMLTDLRRLNELNSTGSIE